MVILIIIMKLTILLSKQMFNKVALDNHDEDVLPSIALPFNLKQTLVCSTSC